jgi:hypothetical protein
LEQSPELHEHYVSREKTRIEISQHHTTKLLDLFTRCSRDKYDGMVEEVTSQIAMEQARLQGTRRQRQLIAASSNERLLSYPAESVGVIFEALWIMWNEHTSSESEEEALMEALMTSIDPNWNNEEYPGWFTWEPTDDYPYELPTTAFDRYWEENHTES